MHRGLSSKLGLSLIICCFLFTSLTAQAGSVTKVQGKKIKIKLSSKEVGSVMEGDTILLTTKKGKTKAKAKVKRVSGKNVLAIVSKGKAKKGYKTKIKKSKKQTEVADSGDSYNEGNVVSEDNAPTKKDLLFGLLGGYGLASQSVNQGADGTSNQSGSSLAVKAIVDYSLFDEIGVRAHIGAEMFSVTGTGTNFQTATAGDIGTDITYLSIDVLLRYRFMISSSIFGYLNGGVGIWSPLSKSSTSLDETSISTTSIFIFGGGIGLPIGSMDLFFGADYYYFPPSEDVSTSIISPKLGLIFEI